MIKHILNRIGLTIYGIFMIASLIAMYYQLNDLFLAFSPMALLGLSLSVSTLFIKCDIEV